VGFQHLHQRGTPYAAAADTGRWGTLAKLPLIGLLAVQAVVAYADTRQLAARPREPASPAWCAAYSVWDHRQL